MTPALASWFWLPISLPCSGTSQCSPSYYRPEPRIHTNKRMLQMLILQSTKSSVKGTCHYSFVRSTADIKPGPALAFLVKFPSWASTRYQSQPLHSPFATLNSNWEALSGVSFSPLNNALRTYWLIVKKGWDIISQLKWHLNGDFTTWECYSLSSPPTFNYMPKCA